MPRPARPHLIDTAEFTRTGATLSGHEPAGRLLRLASMLDPDAPGGEVDWSLTGHREPQPDGGRQPWLALRFHADLGVPCTRCLRRVPVTVDGDRRFLLVADEAVAARADAETDDYDVLVGSRRFDVLELLEDEVIMALPLVPRHERCDLPAGAEGATAAESAAAGDEAPSNPFAVLGRLRRPDPH